MEERPYQLHAVAAVAVNRVIGRQGKLPWHLPDDLRFFKQLTLGHPIVMGRKTWESLGRPLPKRRNIVISRTLGSLDGAEVIAAPEALDSLGLAGPVYVIGGAEIYRLLWDRLDSLYLSKIPAEVEGDTWFPEYEAEFPKVERVADFADFIVDRHWRVN